MVGTFSEPVFTAAKTGRARGFSRTACILPAMNTGFYFSFSSSPRTASEETATRAADWFSWMVA